MDRMREFVPSLRGDRLKEPHYYWPTPSERYPFVDPYDRVAPTPLYEAPPSELPYEPIEIPNLAPPQRPMLIAPAPATARPYEPQY